MKENARPGTAPVIRPVERSDLPALFAYLDDHLRDNGKDGIGLFQPMTRAESAGSNVTDRIRRESS